jgi:DNA-binding MarR family transcriptional regulator
MRDLDTLLRATAGLSIGAFSVMHLLTHDPGASLRLTEIAEQTRITISGVSRIVATLCEQGFAERLPDHDDGRAWRIVLTPAGERQIDGALPAVTAFMRERFTDRFSTDELETLRRLCERLQHPSTTAQ